MKAYYYLLFRIYRFYTDKIKEKDFPLIYACSVSTIFFYFNLYTVYAYIVYKNYIDEFIPSKYYVLIPMAVIWLLNYFFFVKRKRFLDFNFKKDVKGGMLIVAYFLFTVVIFIIIAKYQRAEIFEEEHKHPVENHVKRNSLRYREFLTRGVNIQAFSLQCHSALQLTLILTLKGTPKWLAAKDLFPFPLSVGVITTPLKRLAAN